MYRPGALSFDGAGRIVVEVNCCVVTLFGEAHQWARAHFLFELFPGRNQNHSVSGKSLMAAGLDAIRSIVERVASASGLEVVEVDLRGGGKARMLRVTIDKPGGVTHEDCANLSREVGTILDVEDAVPGGSYTLEVSSPGLDRPLLRPADYERFVGSLIKLTTRELVGGSRHFEGRLESANGGRITVDVTPRPKKKKETPPPKKIELDLANIEKANLVPEF